MKASNRPPFCQFINIAIMLKITPIQALADNYIWLLQQGNEAVCIDPGEAAPVIGYLKAHGLALHQIWITHHHEIGRASCRERV